MRLSFISLAMLLLTGCSVTSMRDNSSITSMQMIDRNGFSETVSSRDRLSIYQKVNFLTPQPYQKVLRVFGKDKEGKSTSKITSYHSNGQVWQYLEVVDGRAHGTYQEWHPNGKLKIDAFVIEGTADINEIAQASWLFDGKNSVWDEEGLLVAEIYYSKGELQGQSFYYYPDGSLFKVIPYDKNRINGTLKILSPTGDVLEKMEYDKGLKQGISFGMWTKDLVKYQENYEKDLLMTGTYCSQEGALISEIQNGDGFQANFEDELLYSMVQFHQGIPEGQVKIFDQGGMVQCTFAIKDGKKHGEEWEFYPKSTQPKLSLFWQDDAIQGLVKTWYDNGAMESQKEFNANKKHGHSFAWYKDGQIMFIEEYESDVLLKGSYFKKGDKLPTSKIDHGKGVATLYDGNGHFLKKIQYDRGKPLIDTSSS